jgi:hypothetical protein
MIFKTTYTLLLLLQRNDRKLDYYIVLKGAPGLLQLESQNNLGGMFLSAFGTLWV